MFEKVRYGENGLPVKLAEHHNHHGSAPPLHHHHQTKKKLFKNLGFLQGVRQGEEREREREKKGKWYYIMRKQGYKE